MTDLITGDSAGAPANAVGIATSAAYGTFHPSNPMHIAMMRNPQPLGLNTSAVSTTHTHASAANSDETTNFLNFSKKPASASQAWIDPEKRVATEDFFRAMKDAKQMALL